MSNADVYIQKYKELETIVRKEFGIDIDKPIAPEFKNRGPYRRYYDDVNYCSQVRNLLQHKAKINGDFAVEPNVVMIHFLEDLTTRIKNRKRCADICVKRNEIYTCDYSFRIRDVMAAMKKNTFTHIPVVENEKVIGVFDENALFTYLSDQIIVDIDEIVIGDLKEYVSLFQREMEEFIFVKRSMYVDELQDVMQEKTDKGKRLGAVFVTLTGEKDGALCGLLTPWDIVGV